MPPANCSAGHGLDLPRPRASVQMTIYKFELGVIPQSGWVLVVLRTTLEAAGVEFDDSGPGVRLRKT